MERKQKLPSKRPPAAARPPARPGEVVVGPGVVKRPRQEGAAPAAEAQLPAYTPSEQVFRRRAP